jgi:hypothetical protein
MIYHAEKIRDTKEETHSCIDGEWVLARPIGLGFCDRLRTAWKVLTGELDGLKWGGHQ